jgi:6-phosphogluconolactonase/glucosamine-6-phosphate isomerase/deaminase
MAAVQEKSKNGHRILYVEDYAFTPTLQDIVLAKVADNPDSKIVLSSGKTFVDTVTGLASQRERFRHATFIGPDEYAVRNGEGSWELVPEEHPASFQGQMRPLVDLIRHPGQGHLFPGAENAITEGVFDAQLDAIGGVDLWMNGHGENDAHILGFNDGKDKDNKGFFRRTRLTDVNQGILTVNSRLNNGLTIPPHAITTGPQTGWEAAFVVTALTGSRKADIFQRVMESPPTPDLPSSMLRHHPNNLWVVSHSAGKKVFG